MFTITEMDHIVLTVQDMDKVMGFYTDVLGLKPERLDAFRQGKVPFPSVRINADTIIDLFPVDAGSGQASDTASKISITFVWSSRKPICKKSSPICNGTALGSSKAPFPAGGRVAMRPRSTS